MFVMEYFHACNEILVVCLVMNNILIHKTKKHFKLMKFPKRKYFDADAEGLRRRLSSSPIIAMYENRILLTYVDSHCE
jgi:hypothetical protein